MSRSGYDDDYGSDDQWALIMWRGAVASATKGKRGQALLREMRDALDAMPVKALVADDLVTPAGEVCALGAVAVRRGMTVVDAKGMQVLDPEDREAVAKAFGIAEALAAEIAYMNDDGLYCATNAERWTRMRKWVEEQILKEPA